MAGFRSEDFYEEDPFGKTIKEIYDDMDKHMEEYKNDPHKGEDYGIYCYPDLWEDYGIYCYPDLWEDEANTILEDVGIEPKFSVEGYSEANLKRIYDRYNAQSEVLNEYGIVLPVDSVPNFYSEGWEYESGISKLGYEVGKTGVIGRYYRLLLDHNFATAYWLGKFERAVELDNDDLILEVSSEIKTVDPVHAEKELEKIVNKCFSESNDFASRKGKSK